MSSEFPDPDEFFQITVSHLFENKLLCAGFLFRLICLLYQQQNLFMRVEFICQVTSSKSFQLQTSASQYFPNELRFDL